MADSKSIKYEDFTNNEDFLAEYVTYIKSYRAENLDDISILFSYETNFNLKYREEYSITILRIRNGQFNPGIARTSLSREELRYLLNVLLNLTLDNFSCEKENVDRNYLRLVFDNFLTVIKILPLFERKDFQEFLSVSIEQVRHFGNNNNKVREFFLKAVIFDDKKCFAFLIEDSDDQFEKYQKLLCSSIPMLIGFRYSLYFLSRLGFPKKILHEIFLSEQPFIMQHSSFHHQLYSNGQNALAESTLFDILFHGLAHPGQFQDFLTQGLYDPRLLLLIAKMIDQRESTILHLKNRIIAPREY